MPAENVKQSLSKSQQVQTKVIDTMYAKQIYDMLWLKKIKFLCNPALQFVYIAK